MAPSISKNRRMFWKPTGASRSTPRVPRKSRSPSARTLLSGRFVRKCDCGYPELLVGNELMIKEDARAQLKQTSPLAEELAAIKGMFERGMWSAAFDLMSGLDTRHQLDGNALESFATAAYMIGRESTFVELLERAFGAFCTGAEPLRAARSAFWIGLTLMFRGEYGRGSGWLVRSERLVGEHGNDCVEQGYIFLPQVESSLA